MSRIAKNKGCKINQYIKMHLDTGEVVSLSRGIKFLQARSIFITERILINRCNDLNAKFE
jgi:hypothetical protein